MEHIPGALLLLHENVCEIWRRLEFTITHTLALLKWSVTVLIALLFRYIQASMDVDLMDCTEFLVLFLSISFT